MVISLKKFREIVLQMVYSRDLNDHSDSRAFLALLDHWVVPRSVLYQAYVKVDSLFNEIEAIDSFIERFSEGYAFKRISSVERNILRLGVFEMLFEKKTPPKVSISEAVRLSQKFGTPEGGAFVNGVLDAIFQSRERGCHSETELPVFNH